MVCILFFCSMVPESGNFVWHSGQKVGAFRPESRKRYFRSKSPRPTITCDLRLLFYWPWSVYYFSARRRRKAATSFRAAARKLALSGRRAEIVYYAPRKEKTWTVHISCKDVGWPIILPWSVYYFSPYLGRKYHIRVFEPGAKVVLSARLW